MSAGEPMDTRRATRRIEEVGEPPQMIIASGLSYSSSGSGQFVTGARQIVLPFPTSPGPGDIGLQSAGGSPLVYIPPNVNWSGSFHVCVNANGNYIAIGRL